MFPDRHLGIVRGLSRCRAASAKCRRPQELSGRCDRGAPGIHRRGAKRAVRLGRGEMTLDVKGVVNGGVRGEKFLRGASALEPLHLALPPSRRPMRILRPIVLCALARRIVLLGGNPGWQTLAPAGSNRSGQEVTNDLKPSIEGHEGGQRDCAGRNVSECAGRLARSMW